MRTYHYKGYDSAGKGAKGLVEADCLKAARENLAARGIFVQKLSLSSGKIAFPPQVRSVIYEELAELLASGLHLVKSLDILVESPESGKAAGIIASVRDSVRDGSSLSGALSLASKSVSALETAVIDAAEKSASLDVMLRYLATYLNEQVQLKEKIQSALIYPSIVVCAGIAVAGAMLGIMLPKAQEIMDGVSMKQPVLTSVLVSAGQWGALLFPYFLAAVVTAAVLIRRRMKDDALFRIKADRFMFNLPVTGRAKSMLVRMRFARTLSLLLGSGMSVVQAFRFAGKATGSEWVSDLSDIEAEKIKHGRSVSESISQIPPLESGLTGWVRIGETSGGLDRLLDGASQRVQREWDRYTTRCLALLEPVLILVIGFFVMLVSVAVLLPVFSLSHMVE